MSIAKSFIEEFEDTLVAEILRKARWGDLDLRNTRIISPLPRYLKVRGTLDLSNTSIEELPQDLEVRGDLNLTGTQIKELPQGLKLGGHLFLTGTQIKELPQDLEVGGGIYGPDKKRLDKSKRPKIGPWKIA